MRFELYLTIAIALAACGKDAPGAPAGGGPGGKPGKPVEVGIITVKAEPLTLTKELPGRTSAFRVAEVRARVNGIVLKRLFAEGSDVKEGQALFKIDPAPYQAALESAQAQLTRAEANVESAQSLAERYTKLIETNAVSRQEYDDAVAKMKSAKADVAAARATVKSARINLDYTTVKAPIAGRIGRADVTEGAYVQQTGATLLATVQQLDKVYVDMTWSSAEALRMRRALEAGELQTVGGEAKVTIIFEDGRDYGTPGTLQFTDVSVDETTGSLSLRAVVPNPKGELLPGMFVRARLDEGKHPNAILVPQRAVTRDQTGRAVAMVIGKDNKVERRQLVTDRAIRDNWLVSTGLAPGDRVIVEGLQKVRPGAEVTTVAVSPAKQASVGSGSATK
ncbi:MAG: efflux RND transporter periplasmic adaptor subunit [Deltaproteobacteria bacterium]|nr:efflux RND transporter periplasmic adaptor subunit [Deltaproteobacteria bacterium]